MAVVPLLLGAGVRVRVRFVPVPLTTMFAGGKIPVFELMGVTVRALGVSASSTVKPMVMGPLSSSTNRSSKLES